MTQKSIEQVHQEYYKKWMSISGVVGVAIGLSENKPCITVFLSIEAEKLPEKIPSKIEGYSVVIRHTGTFQAYEKP